MTYVMGGRNDDVKRASKPHKKKRPLSAVIEEHEADDSIPRINNNNNDNNSNDDGVTSYYTNSTKADDSSSKLAERGTDASRLAEAAGGESETTVPASSSAQVPCLNLPAAGDGDSDKKDNSSSSSSSSRSPKSPRRSSLRSGRRQALTPSFSPKLGRRGGAPVLTSRLNVPRNTSDSDEDNDDMLSPSDMTRLRQTADRLHLSTRRPSFMQWRAQYVECPEFPLPENAGNGDVTGQHGAEGGRWTAERTERINTALDWILNELQEMRTQDQQLARQLLTIRSDLHQLKLARSCEEHQDMLDDVQSELEDLQEFADVLDLPVPTLSDSPLKHLGVTRMNFSARRFSTC